MIQNIRRFDLVQMLGSRENAEKLEKLLRVIERTNVTSLSDYWSRVDEMRNLTSGRLCRGDEHMFYCPHNECSSTYNEDWYLVFAPRVRLLIGNPVG